jgi:hypothetical protein
MGKVLQFFKYYFPKALLFKIWTLHPPKTIVAFSLVYDYWYLLYDNYLFETYYSGSRLMWSLLMLSFGYYDQIYPF